MRKKVDKQKCFPVITKNLKKIKREDGVNNKKL